MRKRIVGLALALVLVMVVLSPLASAQGPFEKECPTCHGTRRVTCPNCQGSGKITTTQTCPTCHGSGYVKPRITLKSMNGWGTLVGLDWVARVEGVFHNEEDVGTYVVATSKVRTVTSTYYHNSERTYLPPHRDVTIRIDTPEITFGEDWTYTIYLSEVDDITCPNCHGTGAKSVLTDCPKCGGSGWITCPECGGSGYVTNSIAVLEAVVGAVIVVAVIVAVIAVKRRKVRVPTEKA